MRVATTLLVFLALVPAASAQTHVALVLDSSVDMWAPMDDGVERFVAARIAIAGLTTSISDEHDTRLSLWLMGSKTPIIEGDACNDTRLALSFDDGNHTTITNRVSAVIPTGSRPVIAAVVAASTDLSTRAGRRRIVLITSGADSCSGDRRAAARALRGGVELRVVGLALDEKTETAFAAVAPTTNVAKLNELLPALRRAVLSGGGTSLRRQPVSLQLARDGTPVTKGTGLKLTDSSTGATFDLEVGDSGFSARVPPGLYNVASTDSDHREQVYAGLIVSPAGTNTTTLDISPVSPVALALDAAAANAGDTVFVQFWDAPAGKHWLMSAPADTPVDAWSTRAETDGQSGEVSLRLPVNPGLLEVRFVARLEGGLTRVIGSTTITTRPLKASLDHSETAEAGAEISVSWNGPDHRGDHITIARDGRHRSLIDACRYTRSGNPTTLAIPGEDGSYFVRYISGLTGRPLARTTIDITPGPVEIDAPSEIGTGQRFIVSWTEQTGEGGYLVLAKATAPPEEYLSLRQASSSGSTEMTAPQTEGGYEVRFVRSTDNRVIGRSEVNVVSIPAHLRLPEQVRAGTRFEVEWSGPDGPGDFIAIARLQTKPRRYLDFAYTSSGTPANLAAPFRPGTFEVRYVTGEMKILARAEISVE